MRKISQRMLAAAMLFIAFGAFAAEQIEEIVVTGSFIRGTPIDTASPVTVLDRADLSKQGMPTLTEVIRRIASSSGVDGQTNQFQSNASEGTASVNLRGLGAARTLVLINGKRQVTVPARLPGGRFVDINNLPAIAIQRTEILKEGAAATYGSDAIGGVVNFLTRKGFEGVEFSISHKDIDGSDGDQTYGIIVGKDFGAFHLVSSLGYSERSELSTRERDFALQTFADNGKGGWSSIGNPGVFFDPSRFDAVRTSINPKTGKPFGSFAILAGDFGGVKDPNCARLGGTDQSLFCRFRYTDFDNLIEDEENFQWFTELNGEFGGGISFHGEFMYATIDVPVWKTSPSYPPQALFGDIQFVPSTHPGLVAMAQVYDQFQPFIDSGNGTTFYGRLVGNGAAEGRSSPREYETYRIASTLNGTFTNGVGWDLGLTYSNSKGDIGGVDAQIGRTKLAFRGFGGFDCAASLDTAGELQTNGATAGEGGCLYYNPFSNAIRTSQNAVTLGFVNPDFNPAVANSAEILAYLDDDSNTHIEASLLVFDAILQGEMFSGEAAWAVGYQYRNNTIENKPVDLINLNINPCKFVGQTACAAETGLRSFLSGGRPLDEEQDVHSLFMETALHIREDLDVQFSVRYEDYGESDTLDPKIAVRWSPTAFFTLRGSVQTTFRGPDIDALDPSAVTNLSFVGPTTAFKAIDTIGNPALEPEEAFTYNVGIILRPLDELTVTLDYWAYDFDNPLVTEDFNALVTAFSAGGEKRAAVESQIFCGAGITGANCTAPGIERIERLTINGPSIQTSGIDLYVDYTMAAGPGNLTLGLDMSHTLEYEIDDFVKNGVLISSGFDAAGQLNAGNNTRPLPDLKGTASVAYNWGGGKHNISMLLNHVNSYFDERSDVSLDVESQTTVDLHYQVLLLDAARLTFSVYNATDEDPPATMTDLNYDAYTHSAFGRMVKIGLSYSIGPF